MLRLVPVTADDIDILFELVAFSEVTEKETLLAGLIQMSNHFRATNDKMVKMVFTADILNQVKYIVDTFMPADAERHGIPLVRYNYMANRLPAISKRLGLPEFVSFDPKNATPAQKVYLN